MQKMAEAAGIRNPEDFYPEYAEDKVAALKQMAKERASQPPPEVQLEQMKAETQKQLKQVDAEVDQHAAELKAQGDIVKNQAELEADLATAAADREKEITLEAMRLQGEREKQEREISFRTWEKEQTFALEREKMANAAQIAAMKPKPEPGKPAAN
jgi:regulator of protease activity HflC (stomatin/prohibitin superfamily)